LKDLSQEEILEGNRVVERIDKVKLPDAGNFSSLKRELLQGLEDWQEIVGKEAENLLKENNPLSAWISLRNEVNTIKQVLAQLEQFKPDSQFVKDFLKEFVLGEDFNIGDSEHLKVYEEWFGLRIPEAEESLHRLLEINNPKERENLYTFARSVYIKKDEKLEPTPVFRLPKARTRKDLIKDQVLPTLIELHGENELLKYIWLNDPEKMKRGFDRNNVVLEALLAYYADKPDSIETLLLLGITKDLVKNTDHGLEKLYGLKFDLLKDALHKGTAGFYETQVKKNAGMGSLDVFLVELIKKNQFDLPKIINTFTAALKEEEIKKAIFMIMQNFGVSESIAENLVKNYLLSQFNKFSKMAPKFKPEEIIKLTINYISAILEATQKNLAEISQLLKDKDIDKLTEIFGRNFGWNPDTQKSLAEFFIEEYKKAVSPEQILVKFSLLLPAREKMAEEIKTLIELRPLIEQYLTAKGHVFFGLEKDKSIVLNLFNVKDMGVLSFYASEVLIGKRILEKQKEFLQVSKELVDRAGAESVLKTELGIDTESDEYKFNLELYKFKEKIEDLTDTQIQEFNNTFIDGKFSYWVERIIRKKISIDGLVKILEFRDKVSPILQNAGLLEVKPQEIEYKVGFEEFLIEQALQLNIKPEELKKNAQLMNLMQKFYPFFYQKGIKFFWANEMLKEVNKGKTEEEALNFFAKLFPAMKAVENILKDFPEELRLTDAGRESLKQKILKEKREEKGRELTSEEIALFSTPQYLEAQFKNGVVSFWAREMLNKGLTEDGLRETFKGRRSALPLLSTYLGEKMDNTDPFVNGLLSLVAEGLREGEFNIVQAIDKEFISALMGDERQNILSLMYDIARLSIFSDFLGINPIKGTDKEVEEQIEELSTNQKGFLMYLTNLAWRLGKKNGKENISKEITYRLSTLKEFLILYGWTKPEEIEKIISDSRWMGRLSFFAEAVTPLSKLEIEKQASSLLFNDFLKRYNNGKPIPENLKAALGEKVSWSNEMWQVFKAHLEKFLGRKLLSSLAKVKTLPKSQFDFATPVGQFVKMVRSQLGDEEVLRINQFVRDVLGESISENEADFIYQHHLDKELLHRWAVILETFIGKSKTVEDLENNWKKLVNKMVEIGRKFEPYMSEYLREDYDVGNSEHTGLVGWLTEIGRRQTSNIEILIGFCGQRRA
ncbi:MAG: hypothetical protein NC834_06450, partial [Candidatus Omnitrophica bacterium]|nr:hypothetical protein [Candidatus Omnitrophota bacterium]